MKKAIDIEWRTDIINYDNLKTGAWILFHVKKGTVHLIRLVENNKFQDMSIHQTYSREDMNAIQQDITKWMILRSE